MSLDILVVSQFFSPEMGAPAARFHDFGRLLIERGHRVTVLTGFPNFPASVVRAEYRGRAAQREEIDGIQVLRSWLWASPRQPKLSKSLGYASFAASASLQALLRRPRADVVIATSPPPTVAIPGMLAARVLRAPLVFDVRDIWPEAIVESGRLERGFAVRSLEAVERAVYRAASAVTVVTDGKKTRLIEKGVPEGKIAVIPNGVDLSRFDLERPIDALLAENGVDCSRFLILYAGIFGPSQGLDVIFDAAKWLREHAPEAAKRVQFVMVGNGVDRPRLEERWRNEGHGSAISFLPEQLRENIPPLLRAANAVLVPLRARRDTHTVPSKIYESMASGRPLLVSANGAPAEILNESEAGLGTPAGDGEGLATSICQLLDAPERCREYGRKGRAFSQKYDRRQLVEDFERVLLRIQPAQARTR